jgi:hypothetical protein
VIKGCSEPAEGLTGKGEKTGSLRSILFVFFALSAVKLHGIGNHRERKELKKIE